uniref:ADP-ribosylation factor-like protein 6 n=1 Tax=Panagrellus redivivus TaxID=6233 RepID=A0A7E4ZXY5_PANRE
MGLASSLLESSSHDIVLLGLNSAGKTTVLYRLKRQKMVLPAPTVGFNCEKIRVTQGPARGHTFSLWDISGQESYRSSWPTYLKNATALVFVIDASDSCRFEEAKVELDTILTFIEERISIRFPVLLLANKQDIPEAESSESFKNYFTKDLKDRFAIKIIPCCAVTGEGLEQFFNELLYAFQSSRRSDR